ncbi:uncharacterized protein [Oryctolagus cuniculus]|uniref:uncharacterized protein isoform X2 n=1 Tax=Oryctolagus cuniculus TaxID=9986 RepID=UPI0022320A28|nr:uncharacterized protein LOC103352463 isoform X2 [Oryctolagus cuniculus]
MTEVDAGRRPCPSAAFLQQPDSFFVLFFLSINQLFLSAVWTVAPFPYRWLLALLHSAGRWAVPLPPFSQGRLQPKPWVSGRSNPEPCSWTEAWMERPSWASLSLLGFAHGRYCCTPKTASRGEEEVTAEGVRGARQGPASHGSGRSFRKSSKEAVVTCSVHVIGSEDLPVGQDGETENVWSVLPEREVKFIFYKSLYVVQIFILVGVLYYYFQESLGKIAPDYEISGESSQRPKIKRGKKQASKAKTTRVPGGLNGAVPKEETDILSQEERKTEISKRRLLYIRLRPQVGSNEERTRAKAPSSEDTLGRFPTSITTKSKNREQQRIQ